MDKQELLVEIDRFLNEFGLYTQLLDWAEQRGFDKEEFESDFEKHLED